MNVFGIGLPEMALILVVALLVFGPKKLPEIGRSMAQALNSFKKAQQEFESEIKKETEELQKSVNAPMKAKIERPEPKALPESETPELETAEVETTTVEATDDPPPAEVTAETPTDANSETPTVSS